MPKVITSHDVLEPLKQVLSASRDVIISGQIWGSKLQRVFTLGDGCWLPIGELPDYLSNLCPPKHLLHDFLGGVLGLLPVDSLI